MIFLLKRLLHYNDDHEEDRIYTTHRKSYKELEAKGYVAYCEYCGALYPSELPFHEDMSCVTVFTEKE